MKENSIEEDIKDIKKYISFTSKRENFSHDTDWNWNKDLANKIEHILSDYKRVLERNEVLLKDNEELEEINNELEAEKNEAIRIYNFETIPVQKVKDKIRHYQELQDNYIKKYDEINEGLQAMINVLQELLEGRKENESN